MLGKANICYSPYHLASSSSRGEAAAALALAGAAADFFLKRATVLKVAGDDAGVGAAGLATPLNLTGLPSISETYREVAAAIANR